MSATLLLILSAALSCDVLVLPVLADTECTMLETPCSCKMSNGSGIIDLKPIATPQARFHQGALSALSGDYEYFYNPCTPVDYVSPGGTCSNEFESTAVCQLGSDGTGTGNRCGSLKDGDVKFTVGDDRTVNVTYTGGYFSRQTNVTLVCDKNKTSDTVFKFVEEHPASHYHFTLTSYYCCVGATSTSSKKGLLISGGSIFLILFASLLVVYLVAGVLFQKFGRGAQGKELIPNYALWSTLPGLIKDGVLFVFSKCRRAGKGYDALQ